MIRMNKKGGLTDIFVFMILALALVVIVIIGFYAGNTIYAKMTEQAPNLQKALGTSGDAQQIIDDTIGKIPTAFNAFKWITTMLIFGMFLSILLSSYLISVRPVYFVPYIILSLIAIVVSVSISNTYETLYQQPLLKSSFEGFYGQTYIFLHLPIWVTVIQFVSGILMFINMKKNEEGYYT